jgi:hypothetical protein
MLAKRKAIIADRAVGEIGDALEDFGAPDLEKRSRRSRIYPRDICATTRNSVASSARTSSSTRAMSLTNSPVTDRLRNFGLYDLLQRFR